MVTDNPILKTDSYKASHYLQYPPGTTRVRSYIESRGGAFDKVLFFGLQGWLKSLRPITRDDIAEAEDVFTMHGLPFNRKGWEHIYEKHAGHLPLEIEALPEGSIVPTHTTLVQLTNTDPEVPWLTSYVETALLRACWYPTTVATVSRHAKEIISKYLVETCDDPASVLPFRLHDFGARGVSSGETAAIGGAAHLVNFMGTDTVEALMYLRKFYKSKMAGFSIPAAEHSTITSWGREHEVDAYRNMVDQFGLPGKLFAVVSDSYDIDYAVRQIWGKQLRHKVQSSMATLVVRPDSGDPLESVINAIQDLGETYGTSLNRKGFRVLDPAVRVIQGDGVNLQSIERILGEMKRLGWSAENVAFGMGGALLQQVNRDTLKFAQKACDVEINGHWLPIKKDPIGDHGKASKPGRRAVIRRPSGEVLDLAYLPEDEGINLLEPVWKDGWMLREQSLDAIRAIADGTGGAAKIAA
jgi:nicotinamide phosphoribosyltransferase